MGMPGPRLGLAPTGPGQASGKVWFHLPWGSAGVTEDASSDWQSGAWILAQVPSTDEPH